MKIDYLSAAAQEGLRLWAEQSLGDAMMLEGIDTEAWAWLCYLLKVSSDRPEWFPKGKSATIQFIETQLLQEAVREVGNDEDRSQ